MTYRRIRSLSRGIEVLRYLNTVIGAQPADICRALKLPRATVHRVLDTLKEFNLVYQAECSAEFRLTSGVRRLASVKDVHQELREAAWPVMRELTARVVWPCDLAVFQDGAMMIIESTHRLSPLSVDVGMVGRPRQVSSSPLGRALLAHCDDEQREAILRSLKNSDEFVGCRDALEVMIKQGRRDGFSMCPELPHDRCASLAVPIRYSGRVVGCMNLVWNVNDVTYDWARDHLSGPLMAARNTIELRLAEMVEIHCPPTTPHRAIVRQAHVQEQAPLFVN